MNYKYNLYWLLQELPNSKRLKAQKWLSEKCGIGLRQFQKWMYTKQGDTLQIPFSCLVLMADFFNVEVEDMTSTEKKTGTREEFENYLNTGADV